MKAVSVRKSSDLLKVISKGCRAASWIMAEVITKTLSKFLWHEANLVRHTNSLLNASDAKYPELATRVINTASISRMPTQDKSLSKNRYLF